MFNKIKQFHTKFGLVNNEGPTFLSAEEYKFRIRAMAEELFEYLDAVYLGVDISAQIQHVVAMLDRLELRESPDGQEQLDALVDLCVFTMGTAERQGFNFDGAFDRVMAANLAKELAGSNENSKRGFSRDLVKPAGWEAPNFDGLMDGNPTGIIILEGPDGCGKTTLAEHLIEKFNVEYIHLTWSEDLEKVMDEYQIEALDAAKELSKEKLVIIDRHWLSEVVYSNVYRNGSQWNGLHQSLMYIINEAKAINVVCFPENINDYHAHYEQLKTEREEMYDNTLDVYAMYCALWNGVYHNTFKSPICNKIVEQGGLEKMHNTMHYDFMLQGNDLNKVSDSIIAKLIEVQYAK